MLLYNTHSYLKYLHFKDLNWFLHCYTLESLDVKDKCILITNIKHIHIHGTSLGVALHHTYVHKFTKEFPKIKNTVLRLR